MKYLITGGTGFFAEAMIAHIEAAGHKIRVVARNEGKLIALKQAHPDIEIVVGDIAEPWVVQKAMDGIDGVFHFAAVKGVDVAETETFITAQTNIGGTMNLLEESFRSKPQFVLFTSTDKAARVSGVYGATKLIGEALFREAERMNPKTDYRVVRFGNILYSTGSVLVKWREKMKKGEKVYITDPEMTRFFCTREQAVDLVLDCLEKATDATAYVPAMKSIKMGDLLEAMMQKYGRVEVEVIGNRGGENMHESLGNGITSDTAEKYTVEEITAMI